MGMVCLSLFSINSYAQICDDPLTVTIEGSTTGTPLNDTGVTDNPDCNDASGDPDGSIILTVTGGTPDYEYLWQPGGQTSKDLLNIGEGLYSVIVTDDAGCSTAATFQLTEPTPVAVTGTPTQPICNVTSGDLTGAIDITASGGTEAGDYEYTWTTSDGSGLVDGQADQTGLGAGTYTVVVTDDNDCTATESWTLIEPAAVVVTGVQTDLNCHSASGDPIGAIDITASGGTEAGDYEYTWTTIDGSGLVDGQADQTGLSAGTYTVVVTDDNDCTATESWTLTEPTAVLLTSSFENLDCHSESGDPTGSISITATGGTEAGDYEYVWSTTDGSGLDVNGEDQTGLSEGTYTVVVTDDNGCTVTESWTLTQPTEVVLTGTPTDLNCNIANGLASGAIDIDVTGGTEAGDYEYNWESADGFGLINGQADQTGLTAGTYTVTVTDDNGCTDSATWTLTQPTIIVIDAQETDLTCHADSGTGNGEIDITVTGGQGSVESDYDYTWATLDGSGLVTSAADQTGLTAGTYSLTVEDSNGCTQTAEFTLEQPTAVEVSGEVTDLICHADSGDPTGAIDITVVGGQGTLEADYDYEWTTTDGSGLVAGQADQTGLSAGTYVVVVTDGNDCTDTETFVLTQPTPVVCELDSPVVGEGGTNILCAGDTGTIDVTASGGTAPYLYSLDGGTTTQTSATFEVLAGTHTVTVIDANGCESICEITLTEPAAMFAGTCVTDDTCQLNLGEIEVCAEGGVGPYQVTWTSPTGGTLDQESLEIDESGNCVTFTGAEGGHTYTFTVTDANLCQLGG